MHVCIIGTWAMESVLQLAFRLDTSYLRGIASDFEVLLASESTA